IFGFLRSAPDEAALRGVWVVLWRFAFGQLRCAPG
ncbi:hypothetical protein A2U01_0049088, partial [Trifolium medium]|nr:hypothetical protein [Trifolium medium]